MHPLSEKIKEELLPFVIKPGRYLGNELNIIRKEPEDKLKFALVYPDIYEIGMSYLGLQILYHIINKRTTTLCERAFLPWPDAEELFRGNSIPLFSLESHTPLKDFDILGFSLTYELNYNGVLNILDLAGIPLFSEERLLFTSQDMMRVIVSQDFYQKTQESRRRSKLILFLS